MGSFGPTASAGQLADDFQWLYGKRRPYRTNQVVSIYEDREGSSLGWNTDWRYRPLLKKEGSLLMMANRGLTNEVCAGLFVFKGANGKRPG